MSLPPLRRHAYFDIQIGDQPAERVLMELYDDTVPKTVENFVTLCQGTKDLPDVTPVKKMTYENSIFHRVIPGFMIQGGDYTNFDGTGGCSIYGDCFEDEAFPKEHVFNRAGLLAMANRGPNTNGSQFFITCDPCPHLNAKHVIFGRVIRGMNVVRKVEYQERGQNDSPFQKCKIVACGVIEPTVAAETATTEDSIAVQRKAWEEAFQAALVEFDAKQQSSTDGDAFADYPQDAEPALTDDQKVEAAEAIRLIGNQLFTAGSGEAAGSAAANAKFEKAIAKYGKACRYLDAITLVTTTLKPTVDKKRLTCMSNSTQCYLKLQKYVPAKKMATQAIDGVTGAKDDVKLIFRRGMASAALNDFEDALVDFQRCAQLDAANADVQSQIARCQAGIKERKEKQAAAYKKMFA